MIEVLQEQRVNVTQIESTVIDITEHYPSQLDQAGIHAMANAVNANWDTLPGVLNNNAQLVTALAILRQLYLFHFQGLDRHRRG